MKRHNKYALLGLQALQRAVQNVAEEAKKNNLKIPVWKNGHIEYIFPEKITQKGIVPNRHSAGAS